MEHVVKINLPRPHINQQKILESKARWRVVLAGRRFGKTLICHVIAIKHMLAGKAVAYITPTHELGRTFIKQIFKYLPEDIVRSYNQTDRKIELVTGGSITFYSGEAGVRIRGNHYDCAIIDEGAFIPDLQALWEEELLPALIDKNGKGIFISTPNGKDYFHSLYMKGVNKEQDYESFHFSSYDNPTLPEGAVELLRKEMTEATFKSEILAIAGENQTSAFGNTDAISRNVIPELSKNPTVSFGIDTSTGYGTDYTVIIGLDAEGRMSWYDRFKQGAEFIMDKIKALPSNVYKIMDAGKSSHGGAIYDLLRSSVPNLHAYEYTEASKNELMVKLIKDVELNKLKFTQPVVDEMSVFEFKKKANGNYSYNAKAGFNDDCVNAIALANVHLQNSIQQSTWKVYTRRT